MSDIFSKTAKGQEEIKTRAGGLTQRMRQVLIFVDGKRSREELHGMLKGDDMDDLVAALIEDGYIEVSGTAVPKAAPQPATSAATASAPAAAAPKAAAPAQAAAQPATPPAAGKPPAKPDAPTKPSPEELERRRLEAERQSEIDMARSFLGKMS